MTARLSGATRNRVRMYRFSHSLAFVFLFLVVFLFVKPASGFCSLSVEFLLDRSGSLWAPLDGTSKTILVADAVEKVIEDLPDDVAIGLRVYPPPVDGEASPDPGLRIAIRTGTRDQFPRELAALNPRGKASLSEHLKKAIEDFPKTDEGRLLILITDGADNEGTSFCNIPLFSVLPDAFRFHLFSLNLENPDERDELSCLSRQLAGEATHLTTGNALHEKLLALCLDAHRKEAERQARLLEERRIHDALQSKTRLQVTFQNTLDPFFADSLQVISLRIDGQQMPQLSPVTMASGSRAVILEQPAPQGEHELEIQYKMSRGDDFVLSRVGSLHVFLEEGTTTSILAVPHATLFSWACALQNISP
jgi:hypothetical protein